MFVAGYNLNVLKLANMKFTTCFLLSCFVLAAASIEVDEVSTGNWTKKYFLLLFKPRLMNLTKINASGKALQLRCREKVLICYDDIRLIMINLIRWDYWKTFL